MVVTLLFGLQLLHRVGFRPARCTDVIAEEVGDDLSKVPSSKLAGCHCTVLFHSVLLIGVLRGTAFSQVPLEVPGCLFSG